MVRNMCGRDRESRHQRSEEVTKVRDSANSQERFEAASGRRSPSSDAHYYPIDGALGHESTANGNVQRGGSSLSVR